MKKILFSFMVFVLIACAPQATATSDVTVTLAPPTETPIPTPTLHPQFIELQNLIADSSQRLTLLPDGSIEDNGTVIPNLHVDQNGIINLIINNEHVGIDSSQISFDDVGGFSAEGYELNDEGEWVEAVSAEILEAQADIEKFGYLTENLEFKQNGDDVWAVDKESGKTVYEKDGDSEYGLFYQWFAVEQAGQLDLMPTNIEPRQDILDATGQYFVADRAIAFEYFGPLSKRVRVQFEQEFGYKPVSADGDLSGIHVMLNPDPEGYKWGFVIKDLAVPELDFSRYLYYELADGIIHIVPLQ